MSVSVIFAPMKEVIRCKKVHDGVAHATKVYPNGYLIMAIIGIIKGNGAAFLKISRVEFGHLMQLKYYDRLSLPKPVLQPQ